MTIADAIYLLCAATSLVTAGLLLRQYRARRTRLLLWSSAAFVGLAINNVLVYVDYSLWMDGDLSLPRTLAGALAMLVLVFGLIWVGGS